LGDFLITAYTNSPGDTGKSADTSGYGITASGAHTVAGTTIAADWNVLPEGTVVQIEGLPGTYTVQDTGSAVRGKHIDLFVETEQQAVQWGRRERKVTVIRWGTSHS
jgi:3D (Asp-Asp-Asp) domain-containing protein